MTTMKWNRKVGEEVEEEGLLQGPHLPRSLRAAGADKKQWLLTSLVFPKCLLNRVRHCPRRDLFIIYLIVINWLTSFRWSFLFTNCLVMSMLNKFAKPITEYYFVFEWSSLAKRVCKQVHIWLKRIWPGGFGGLRFKRYEATSLLKQSFANIYSST